MSFKTIKISKNQTTNMEGNVHLANLEYGLCNVYSYKTHSFHSEQNGRIFTIFHRVNRKGNFVIYLLEYVSHTICRYG